MASLDILCFNYFNLNYENRTSENISWPIKNFEKHFMAHQYMPKKFHSPHKNPPPTPNPTTHCSYILNVQSLPTQIVNLTAEIVIPIGMQTKEVKAEMETHPVTVEIKISKYSI